MRIQINVTYLALLSYRTKYPSGKINRAESRLHTQRSAKCTLGNDSNEYLMIVLTVMYLPELQSLLNSYFLLN
jgi:hypothetical protein